MELTKLSEEALNRPPEDVFDILYQIGKGSYGSVYKSIHKESRKVVAIKQVPIDADLQDMIKEISIMQQCDSPYVVKYYGSYFKGTDLWIVMEFCGAGSVLDIMKLLGKDATNLTKRQVKTFNEEQIATILYDTLRGLEYLHLRKKIHRDIKAGNILLNSEGNAKLADFGVAAQLTNTMAKRNTVIGTPFWMAPEVIQDIGYDCVADIWSLGITALEMAEGKVPYIDIHPMRAMFKIPSNPPPSFNEPDKWSSEFIDFVSQCLVKNPQKRATASELLKDEFILNMAKSSDILIPAISKAQQIRDSLQELCPVEEESGSESENKTLVEDKQHATITSHVGMKQPEQGCETMIQHSTIPTNGESVSKKHPSNSNETNEVGGISSKLETLLSNVGETNNYEDTNESDHSESNQDIFCTSDQSSSHQNLQQTQKQSKTLNARRNSSNLCDIEIAEQMYMNANMISRLAPDTLYSNFPQKKHGIDLPEISSTNDLSTDTKENDFKFIKCLTNDELKAKLQNLDHEMELEIKRITEHYYAKRQPILDGIDEKRKHQQNF